MAYRRRFQINRHKRPQIYVVKRFVLFLFLMLSLIILPALSEAAPNRIKVRAGQHERFERLVFDCSGNSTTIQFNRPALPETSALDNTPLALIKNFGYTNTDKGLKVSFTVADQTKIQAFWAGNKVAFDIQKLTTEPPSFGKVQKSSEKNESVSGPVRVDDIQSGGAVDPEAADKARLIKRQLNDDTDLKASGGNDTKITVGETAITFKLTKVVKAAAFIRGHSLWVLFDAGLSSILPQVQGALAEQMSSAQRVSKDDMTGFRFDLPADKISATLIQDKLNWQIKLSNNIKNSGDRLEPEVDFTTRPADPRVFVPLEKESASILTLEDPQVGDQLTVIALSDPSKSIGQNHYYPQFRLIPTIHGVVIKPLSDTILTELDQNGTLLIKGATDKPLILSPETDRMAVMQQQTLDGSFQPRLFNMREWSGGTLNHFENNRRKIEERITRMKGAERAVGFIDLAKLYVSNGFGPEAVGILRVASDIVPDLLETPDFIVLRGVARALSGYYDIAQDDFNSFNLNDQEETQLWLGYIHALKKEWDRAQKAFSRSGVSVEGYPPVLRRSIRLLMAESDLQAGQVGSASRILTEIRQNNASMSIGEKAAFSFLQAKILKATGNEDKAIETYRKVLQSRDRLYRAKTEMDLVPLLLRRDEITVDEAIERLENQRFAWRGDRVEILILEQLAEYYFQTEDYLKGL